MGELIERVLDTSGLLIAIAFVAYFAGFAMGRRWGKREGIAEGLAYAPLEMRRQTWERGHCVICGTTPEELEPDGGERAPGAGVADFQH